MRSLRERYPSRAPVRLNLAVLIALLGLAACSAPQAPQPSGPWVAVNHRAPGSTAPSAGASAGAQPVASVGARSVRFEPCLLPAVPANVAAPSTTSATTSAASAASASSASPAEQDGGHAPGSLLASRFGISAVRDQSGSGLVQLRMRDSTRNAGSALRITTVQGKPLAQIWDAASGVLSIAQASRFVVSASGDVPGQGVEVAQMMATQFRFAQGNTAGLLGVFVHEGATYFKFSPDVKTISVRSLDEGKDADEADKGQRRGAYFRYDGVASKYEVRTDRASTIVNRVSVPRFYERLVCPVAVPRDLGEST